jgi:D,D-heptose 1,7-bisphosphate phosphatase
MKRAVFLDRDGTLIKNKGYICKFKDVEFYPFSLDALKLIRLHNFQIVVITNQSSIARGICSEEQIINIHQKMGEYLETKGAVIDKFYYCPYHPNAGILKYRTNSNLRKPQPGMLFKAAEELSIDLKQSYFIGDSLSDIQAGQRAGCQTILVKTGHGIQSLIEIQKQDVKVDLISENLLLAIKEIVIKINQNNR